jgi:hypothetical protein
MSCSMRDNSCIIEVLGSNVCLSILIKVLVLYKNSVTTSFLILLYWRVWTASHHLTCMNCFTSFDVYELLHIIWRVRTASHHLTCMNCFTSSDATRHLWWEEINHTRIIRNQFPGVWNSGVPRGFRRFNSPPPPPRNSEVLTKSSRIPCSVEDTPVKT